MVLQTSNIHMKRLDENKPPLKSTLLGKIKSNISRSRRTRAAPGSPRFLLADSKRRAKAGPSATIRLNVPAQPHVPVQPRDVEMADGTAPTPVELPRTTVTLPRHLAHPETKEISKDVLRAVEPALADVPLEYIHGILHEAGPSMLQVLSSVTAAPAKDSLPKELSIVVKDISAEMPTHMMAVYSRLPTQLTRRRVTLYPVHNVMLASHCANLPSLPDSHPIIPETPGSSITVPVVPLCIPSPQTYPHLSAYLYIKRADILLSQLLPCPPPPAVATPPDDSESAQKDAIMTFAGKLAATYTPHALLQYAMRVNGLWRNACALGIFDDGLWATMDLAWEIVLCALAIATGNPQAVEATPASSS